MKIAFRNLLTTGALLLLAGCTTVPITGRKQLSLVSDSEILSLSDESYKSYVSSSTVSTDKTKSAMVTRCGTNIKNAVEAYFKAQGQSSQLDGYEWKFTLLTDNTANAFCLPGGKIVVYEGILPYTLNETGLAVVLGHEVAHAIAKHSNERISREMLVQMGGSVLSTAVSGKSAASQELINTVYGLGSNYGVMLPFSRKQELEADKMGLIFMAMAGYDPEEAVAFWSRMSAGSTSATPQILSTHPSDETRIAYIKQVLPEVKSTYYKK
jgi:predicted Zn-dependent protease